MLVDVDAGDPGPAPGQLETVEAGVAADIEHGPTVEPAGQVGSEHVPLVPGKIAEWMIGRGLTTARKVQVVEPRPESLDVRWLRHAVALLQLTGCRASS